MPDEQGTLFETPARIVDTGERIYAEQYKSRLEAEHLGAFVAIDVRTRAAYIGRFPEQALDDARTRAPGGVFHLIRVGSAHAFTMRAAV